MTRSRAIFGWSGARRLRRSRRWLATMLSSQVLATGLAVIVALSGPLASRASAIVNYYLPTQSLCGSSEMSGV